MAYVHAWVVLLLGKEKPVFCSLGSEARRALGVKKAAAKAPTVYVAIGCTVCSLPLATSCIYSVSPLYTHELTESMG